MRHPRCRAKFRNGQESPTNRVGRPPVQLQAVAEVALALLHAQSELAQSELHRQPPPLLPELPPALRRLQRRPGPSLW